MPNAEIISPKACCQLDIGRAAFFCEEALKIANELPNPFKENLRRVIRQGFLEEIRPGVFKLTGKGRNEERAD